MFGDNVKLGGPDDNADKLAKIKNMTISACGTSLHAAMYGAKLMRSLGSFESVNTMDAGETTIRDSVSTYLLSCISSALRTSISENTARKR